jgi:ribosomal protein S6--L-glutamate ligase
MRIGVLTEEVDNEDVAVALKEAGEALGAEVVVINPKECSVINFAKPQVLHNGEPLIGYDAILVRGSETRHEFKMYIVEYLTSLGTLMINPADSIKICNNKFDTQSLLNSIGIKTPNTVALVRIEQLDAAVHLLEEKFPMIVKTVSGSHGVGVIKVETYESLKSLVQYLLANDIQIMIQEFIPHTESGRIMVLGDKVLASVMRSIPDGDFRSNMDQGAELSKYEATPKEAEVALKVAEALGCMLSAIDYIIDADGEMVIFEANSSPGLKGIQGVNENIDIAKEIMQFVVGIAEQFKNQAEVETHEEEEEHEKKKKHRSTKVFSYIPIAFGGSAVKVASSINQDAAEDKAESGAEDTGTEAAEVSAGGDEGGGGAEEEEESVDMVNLTEEIVIKRINDNKPFEGKVDTGADRCSLHGDNLEVGEDYVRFKLEDTSYKVPLLRFVTVLASNGSEKRPIVKFDVVFNGNSFSDVEFNISDRSDMKYQVIIGKNLLEVAKVVVNPID